MYASVCEIFGGEGVLVDSSMELSSDDDDPVVIDSYSWDTADVEIEIYFVNGKIKSIKHGWYYLKCGLEKLGGKHKNKNKLKNKDSQKYLPLSF